MDIIAPISISANVQLISTNIPEAEHSEYAAGTTYAKDAYVQVTDDGVHKIYKSQAAGNVGHYPPDNVYDDTVSPATGYWIEVGATNPWAMFDGLSRRSSSNADSIIVEIKPGNLFNSLALINLEASSAFIEVTDPTAGLVYQSNISLADLSGITDFYSWFFYEPVRKQTAILTDLPSYPDATIKISLAAAGETVVCGEAVAGTIKYIGTLLYGYQVGIKDYSTKVKDADGNAKIKQGVYSDTGTLKVTIPSARVYDVKRLLAGYRAKPLVWIGTEEQQDSIIYGWFSEFSVSIETFRQSYCTIEIEELS